MKIACHTQTWGAVRGHPAGVGSLKDLHYLAKPPFTRALKEIRLLGYQGVEAFDGDVIEWHAAGRDVRREGLELAGVYTGAQFIYDDAWADERARLARVVEAAAAMGARNLVVGGGAVRAAGVAAGDPAKLAARLDELADMAEARGLATHFHPHPHPDGYTEEQVDEVLGRTRMALCPDLGVLAKGKVDPVAFVRRHAARISYVHLKDSRNGEDIEVGQGEVDMAGVLSVLRAAGFGGWMVAELDASESTPFASAQAMLAHIQEKLLPVVREHAA